mgnify:CR=1 FL=1
MANLRATYEICRRHCILVMLDATRAPVRQRDYELKLAAAELASEAFAVLRDHRRLDDGHLDLLNDPVLDRLVTGESPFGTLPGTLASLAGTPDDTLCHRIVYT